jgi:HTH-type transcriptional repressor of NAD biosynthesis genes
VRRGFTIGKFLPPHAGHHYLIDVARANVDALTVAVCDDPAQAIPADLRVRWLAEAHPDVRVISVADTLDDDDSAGWAAYTASFLGYTPDVVFTSETYGDAYARHLGCDHVCVDRARDAVPISATRIRADPLGFLDRVTPAVRAYLVRRICIVGPESTGKSVLGERLARAFDAPLVAEYGRAYTVAKRRTPDPDLWRPDEFVHIAREQQRREDEAARRSSGLVVCDTDAFATEIWLERYLGPHDARGWPQRERPMDLYLLTDPDVPFVQDGIRDGEHLRIWMFDRFREELTRRGFPFAVLAGTYADRDERATIEVRRVLADARIA